MFEGRKLVIATQHGKETVMAPLLEKALGVECILSEKFDTDTLGTFTGEVDRPGDAVETLRKKCLLAMEASGCDLGVASEGSFGPHPTLPFVAADEEWVIFIDQKNGWEIREKQLSTDTNFGGSEVQSEAALLDFAEKALFPSHALILSKGKNDYSGIRKGITDKETLLNHFRFLIENYGTAFVQTDMRAMHNPTRMKVIAAATEKLVLKIQSRCPQCSTPGFGITRALPGLPCGLCGTPTSSTLSYVYSCAQCRFQKEEKYPHGKQTEDPAHCDFCNP